MRVMGTTSSYRDNGGDRDDGDDSDIGGKGVGGDEGDGRWEMTGMMLTAMRG